MKLTSKRLILRLPTLKDAKDTQENINNLKVSRYMTKVSYPYSLKDAKWYINHCSEKAKEKPRKDYNFSIELKSEKKVIGGISLSGIDRFTKKATIGYWLGESYWRKGIMTEALNSILDFAFDKLKLIRIDIEAFTKNKASNALIKKIGFKFEGTRRKYKKTKSTGKWHDSNQYGLLKEEWKNKN